MFGGSNVREVKIKRALIILILVICPGFAHTTIEAGPAVVRIPDRFTIEKESVSDEVDFRGSLIDTRTRKQIRFWINDLWGLKGLHPTKVDWAKIVHFERSMDGCYDRQIFVFEEDESLRIEARYMFQRSMFQMRIPKSEAYQTCLDALQLIEVKLNDGWELTRGKSFDEFKMVPIEANDGIE